MSSSKSESLKKYPGSPLIPGARILSDGKINFCMETDAGHDCGVMIYLPDHEQIRIPFSKTDRYGKMNCTAVEGLKGIDFEYLYYEGDELIPDMYAAEISGAEEWMTLSPDGVRCKAGYSGFDWQEDSLFSLSHENLILYLLHPRGFTMHETSGVEHRGTFLGITEKISYFKDLGINAIELMPSYEFQEMESDGRVNYWGFKPGYYMAPKSAYCAGMNAALEFKTMVKALHENGIGVILQFYFPEEADAGMILNVLRNWKMEYHVDGFHLPGSWIPERFLREDPILSGSHLYFEDNYHDAYLEAARHYLRGEEWSLFSFLDVQRRSSIGNDNVNYVTNYKGFSLADLVSYDKKHNEANGEQNRDGDNNPISWNCGIEGETEDHEILNMRLQQMKNVFAYLLTSQGTPMIMSGDEFAFSRGGNNNPYCQDNDISWLNWNLAEQNRELLDFVKDLIRFRKSVQVMPFSKDISQINTVRLGYPCISWHGEGAWWLEPDGLCRHAGVMYCGNMKSELSMEDQYIYIIYNSDKEAAQTALPRLPDGMRWKSRISSSRNTGKMDDKVIETEARSVVILQAVAEG